MNTDPTEAHEAPAEPPSIPYSLKISPHEALKRDFKAIIPALNGVGFSNIKLGMLAEVDEKTIRKWGKGESEPVYSKAIVLIALFDIYCQPSNSDKRPT